MPKDKFELTGNLKDLPSKVDYDSVIKDVQNTNLESVYKEPGTFSKIYNSFEDKYYKIIEFLHLTKLVDAIEKYVPTFPLLIIGLIVLIIALIIYFTLFGAMSVELRFYKGSSLISDDLDIGIRYGGFDKNYTIQDGKTTLSFKKGENIIVEIYTRGYEFKRNYLVSSSFIDINIPTQVTQTDNNPKTTIRLLDSSGSVFSSSVSANITCTSSLESQNVSIRGVYEYKKTGSCGDIRIKINIGGFKSVDQVCSETSCDVTLERIGSTPPTDIKSKISVSVRDLNSNPLPAFNVMLNYSGTTTNVSLPQTTSINGLVEFNDISPGSYSIVATNSARGLSESRTIELGSTPEYVNFTFNMANRLVSDSNVRLNVDVNFAPKANINLDSCMYSITISDSNRTIQDQLRCTQDYFTILPRAQNYRINIIPLGAFEELYSAYGEDVRLSAGDNNITANIRAIDVNTHKKVNIYVQDSYGTIPKVLIEVNRVAKLTNDDGFAQYYLPQGRYTANIINNSCISGRVQFDVSAVPRGSHDEFIEQDVNLNTTLKRTTINLIGSDLDAQVYDGANNLIGSLESGKLDNVPVCDTTTLTVGDMSNPEFVSKFIPIDKNFYIPYPNYELGVDLNEFKYVGVYKSYNDLRLTNIPDVIFKDSSTYYLVFDSAINDYNKLVFEVSNGALISSVQSYGGINLLRSRSKVTVDPINSDSSSYPHPFVSRIIIGVSVPTAVSGDVTVKYKKEDERNYKTVLIKKGERLNCQDNLCIDVFDKDNTYLGSNKDKIYVPSSDTNTTLKHVYYSKTNYNSNIRLVPTSNFIYPKTLQVPISIAANDSNSIDINFKFSANVKEDSIAHILSNNSVLIPYQNGSQIIVEGIPQIFVSGDTIYPQAKNLKGEIIDADVNYVNIRFLHNTRDSNKLSQGIRTYTDSQRVDGNIFAQGYSTYPFTIFGGYNALICIVSPCIFKDVNLDVYLLDDRYAIQDGNYAIDFNLDVNNLLSRAYKIADIKLTQLDSVTSPANPLYTFDDYYSKIYVQKESLVNKDVNIGASKISGKILFDMNSIRDQVYFLPLKIKADVNLQNPDSSYTSQSFNIKLNVLYPNLPLGCNPSLNYYGPPAIVMVDSANSSDFNLETKFTCPQGSSVPESYNLKYDVYSVLSSNVSYLADGTQKSTISKSSIDSFDSQDKNHTYKYLRSDDSLLNGNSIFWMTPSIEYKDVRRWYYTSSSFIAKNYITDMSKCVSVTTIPQTECPENSIFCINYNLFLDNTGIDNYYIREADSTLKLYLTNSCDINFDLNLRSSQGIITMLQTKLNANQINLEFSLGKSNLESGANILDINYKLDNKSYNAKTVYINSKTSNRTPWYVEYPFSSSGSYRFRTYEKVYDVNKFSDTEMLYLGLGEISQWSKFDDINVKRIHSVEPEISMGDYLAEKGCNNTNGNFMGYDLDNDNCSRYLIGSNSLSEHLRNYNTNNSSDNETQLRMSKVTKISDDANIIVGLAMYSNINNEVCTNVKSVYYEYLYRPNTSKISKYCESNCSSEIANLKTQALSNYILTYKILCSSSNNVKSVNGKLTLISSADVPVSDNSVSKAWSDYKVSIIAANIIGNPTSGEACLEGGDTGEGVVRNIQISENQDDINCEKNMCSVYFLSKYIAGKVGSATQNTQISGNVYLMADNYSKDVIKKINENTFAGRSIQGITIKNSDGGDVGYLPAGNYSYSVDLTVVDNRVVLDFIINGNDGFVGTSDYLLYTLSYGGSQNDGNPKYGTSFSNEILGFSAINAYPNQNGYTHYTKANITTEPHLNSILVLKEDKNYSYSNSCVYVTDGWSGNNCRNYLVSGDNVYESTSLSEREVDNLITQQGYVRKSVCVVPKTTSNCGALGNKSYTTLSEVLSGIDNKELCIKRTDDTEYIYPNFRQFISSN